MADVIIADGKLTPRASVSQVTLDWACGTDENDFELTVNDPDAPEIERGWYFWLDGSDVGGRIVDRRVSVAGGTSTTTWIGQSWTGMLAAKILQPDPRQDYLTVSGKLPDILTGLMKRIGLDGVFTVQSDDSSTVANWRFANPRYVDAYTGFRNLLASCGRRLDFQAKDDHILLGITPVGIITNTIDSDLVDFRAETNRRAVNHLIGLGSQELKNRLVVNYFADATGVVSQTQTLVGADEVCATYDYSNADLSTLQSETKKHLQELQTGGSVEVTLSDEVGDGLRVDDKIVATDQASGVNVTAVVTKRIVKIDSGILTSTFEVGLPVQSANANYSGSSSSSSSSGSSLAAGRGLSISGGTINAEVASEDLDSVRQVAESANRTASGFEAQIGKANQTAEDARNVASGLNESIGKANTTANAAKDSADQARSLASERVKTITAVAPLSASRNGDTVALSAPNTLPAPTSLTSTDLNTLKTGWGAYWASGGNTCANKPSGVGHFGLIVQRVALGWTTQILTDPQTNTIWKRTWNNSSWSKWTALADDRYASQSLRGLMSSGDKKKLDGIQDGANKYTLPVASAVTLGGVKPDGTTIHIAADGTISAANLTDAEASFLAAHPVGSIIMLREGIDPARWGGEWRELPSTAGACVWERIN